MGLVDLLKGKNIPTPNKGATGNIPLNSPQGAGINQTPISNGRSNTGRSISPLGSPQGRHLNSPVNIDRNNNPLAGE